jgi:hypothetical protein
MCSSHDIQYRQDHSVPALPAKIWPLGTTVATGADAGVALLCVSQVSSSAACVYLCRTRIRSWHLAYTRVTPTAVELLSSCADITLLDLRGSGVKAAQLAPLRAKFALSAVQGAVLSRTAAMVLAAVTWEQFVCADAAQHGAAVAASAGGTAAPAQQVAGCGCSVQQWVNQAVAALLQAAAEVGVVPLAGQHPVVAHVHQQWQ